MSKHIYFLTNVLPEKYGGRTDGIFRRVKLLTENNIDNTLLFSGFQFKKNTHLLNLLNENVISENTKIRDMFTELGNGTAHKTLETYSYPAFIESDKVTKRVSDNSKYKKDGFTYKVFFDSFGEVKKRVISKNKTKIKTEFYGSNGKIARIIFFSKGKRSKEIFYNEHQLPYIKVNFFGKFKIIYYKGNKDFKKAIFFDWKSLRAHWVSSTVGNGDILHISARKLDILLNEKSIIKKDLLAVFWYHNPHISMRNREKYIPLENYISSLNYQGNQKIIVLTKEQKEDLIKKSGKNEKDIIVHISQINKLWNDNYEKGKFIMLSRLNEKQKNITLGIDSFALYREMYNKAAKLHIYGFGPDEQFYLDYIKNNGFENFIELKGSTNQAQEIMSRYETYIITSNFEGLGRTMLEAISSGCPVAASNFAYGPKSFIEEGKNGYIAINNEIESVAEAIKNASRINNSMTREEISKTLPESKELIEKEIQIYKKISNEGGYDEQEK